VYNQKPSVGHGDLNLTRQMTSTKRVFSWMSKCWSWRRRLRAQGCLKAIAGGATADRKLGGTDEILDLESWHIIVERQ